MTRRCHHLGDEAGRIAIEYIAIHLARDAGNHSMPVVLPGAPGSPPIAAVARSIVPRTAGLRALTAGIGDVRNPLRHAAFEIAGFAGGRIDYRDDFDTDRICIALDGRAPGVGPGRVTARADHTLK